ncbi:conjugal transfer protein TrbI [Nostoc sp. CENA67]|uniref:Conjugal transfer protein TrbI n=1 Tax=Amazonocrinis nigriterrae CENA67 TaxID=2794033 RepID=A0A8J7HTF9_9NOST|nr:conjugal transfer protein TrbI [Amazonocrinis nigriterrae]MBH8565601.1 conjugal transfer protein TrbI [Amazonocrinis nigriterrae CENA67]
MTRIHQWKSTTAALMTMAITTAAITPMIAVAPANAQQYNIGQSRTVTIPSGVSLPVTSDKDKIVIKPGESASLTLKIPNDITDSNRNLLIPARSEVVGRLEPVYLDRNFSGNGNDSNTQGVRFVAQELIFPSGRRQQINASSRTYTRIEKVSQSPSTGQVLTDAGIGAAAGLLGSLVTGDRKVNDIKPIIGAAAGAGASVVLRKKQVDAFVIRPKEDLRITLDSNLVLSRY